MKTPSQKLRERWLTALLPIVPTLGWTRLAMWRAARKADLSKGEQALAAPNGVHDLLDQFFDNALSEMRDRLAAEDLSDRRTHERVSYGLIAWLDALSPYRKAVRRAAGQGLAPWGAQGAVRRIWRIADAVWDAAGDTATDYNRQTKRALLSAVIPSVILFWLDHDDSDKLQAFIDRRLQQAMTVGRTGGRFVGPLLDFAERVRARRQPVQDP
ncbi:MAG: COQ9 family protein [Pseudomonadota bacterium]